MPAPFECALFHVVGANIEELSDLVGVVDDGRCTATPVCRESALYRTARECAAVQPKYCAFHDNKHCFKILHNFFYLNTPRCTLVAPFDSKKCLNYLSEVSINLNT